MVAAALIASGGATAASATPDDPDGFPCGAFRASLSGGGAVVCSGSDVFRLIPDASSRFVVTQVDPTTPTSGHIEIVGEPDNGSEVGVVLAGVNIETTAGPAVDVQANANVTVMIQGTNTLKTTSERSAALRKTGQSRLVITNHSADTPGTLHAQASSYGAGIGGDYLQSASNITISGGYVTATSGPTGAGIGGGQGGDGTNITINGGSVNATGVTGAGIGGGSGAGGSNITVSGGSVTASSGAGAGIGGGITGDGSDIAVSSGSVTAASELGAGIGGGMAGDGSGIAVSGGSVTAASELGAGIGSGHLGYGSHISITGSDVESPTVVKARGISEALSSGTATSTDSRAATVGTWNNNSASGAATVVASGASLPTTQAVTVVTPYTTSPIEYDAGSHGAFPGQALTPNEYVSWYPEGKVEFTPNPEPTADNGYVFAGWLEKEKSGEPSKARVISSGTTGTLTYVAQYSAVDYPITWDLGEGSWPQGYTPPTTYTVAGLDNLDQNPQRSGYTFMGWGMSQIAWRATGIVPAGTTGAVTLTAQWEQNAQPTPTATATTSPTTSAQPTPGSGSTAQPDPSTTVVPAPHGLPDTGSSAGSLAPVAGFCLIAGITVLVLRRRRS